MHQKRKTNPFETTWRMALSTKRAIFGSFLNVTFLENNVICTFCLAKCIRKGQQIVPFDYMTFKKNVICTFCLAKCSRKGQQNCSFWLHEEWLSPQRHLSRKWTSFVLVALQNASEKENKSFWLHEEWLSPQKCIREGQQNCSFWLHEEWLSLQKEQFCVPFWTSSF